MRVLISSNDSQTTNKICDAISHIPIKCEVEGTLSLADTSNRLSHNTSVPDLLLVVLPSDTQLNLKVIHTFRSVTDTWIVAVGKLDSTANLVGLLQTGADGYIDSDNDITPQLQTILENRKRRKGGTESDQSQLYGVLTPSGGCGGSTIATNLATSIAEQTGECGLFDYDFYKGDLAYHLNLKPKHSVQDLCQNTTLVDQTMLRQSLASHESGVHLLSAPKSLVEMQKMETSQLLRILKLSLVLFSNSVVDLGSSACTYHFPELVHVCTKILIVVKLDFSGLCNARKILDYLERQSIDSSRIVVVANRTGMSGEISFGKAKMILGCDIHSGIPCDDASANLALNCGVPVLLESPHKSMSKAIKRLADSLSENNSRIVNSAHQVFPKYDVAVKGISAIQNWMGLKTSNSTNS